MESISSPKQAADALAFHQQAADEFGGDDLGGAAIEGLGERWEGLRGYGSGLGAGLGRGYWAGEKRGYS